MQKIPTMFERDDYGSGHPVVDRIRPGCEWVLDGEGVATRKLDGMNVRVQGGILYKRQKPLNGEYTDAAYIPADAENPADKYLLQAFVNLGDDNVWDGIYEAIGPKIQGNPEKYAVHTLIRVVPLNEHLQLDLVPRSYAGLRDYLANHDIEGIVFHHADGRLAKIKKRDFGLKR